MPETTEPLTEAHIAEITEAFPHAEYQPTLSPDQVGPCEVCKGTIDDHKAGCVVPLIHALIRDWRAMKVREASYAKVLSDRMRGIEALEASFDKLEGDNTALREQLANVTKERNDWKQRAEEAEADLRETV